MKPYLFLLLASISCTIPPEPDPVCSYVRSEITANGIWMQIDSDSEYVMLEVGDRRPKKLLSHYFGCVSISCEPGTEIIIVDDGCRCVVE